MSETVCTSCGKTFDDAGEGGTLTYFHYDGNLQRYCVEEDGVATYFVWDGLRLLETRNADGTLKARFTHGLARIEGIGSCVEVYRASDAKRFYMLYDHRGSAHVLLDESKTVVATRLFNAFGEMISETGTWPAEVPFGYQSNWLALDGMTLPDGTRLYLAPFRLYHPGIGRFLQRDFLPYLHKYMAWTNSPVMQVDRDGLASVDQQVREGRLPPYYREGRMPEGLGEDYHFLTLPQPDQAALVEHAMKELERRESEAEARERDRMRETYLEMREKGGGKQKCCGEKKYGRGECCLDEATSLVGDLKRNWEMADYVSPVDCANKIWRAANPWWTTPLLHGVNIYYALPQYAVGAPWPPTGFATVANTLGQLAQYHVGLIWCSLRECVSKGI